VFEFAQTNLQLRRQMDAQGYNKDAINSVDEAYRLAALLFSAQYRNSGKPFIAHLVGTASILASHRASTDTLITGLLHAAYMTGDFGFHPGQRSSSRRRAWLRERIGTAAEERIASYDRLHWNPQTLADLSQRHNSLDTLTREVLQVRLANTYEDFMDGAMCRKTPGKASMYCDTAVQKNLLTLADQAEWPQLQELLRTAFQEFNQAQVPVAASGNQPFLPLHLPPSARRRLLPTIEGGLMRRWRRLRRRLSNT